MIVSLRINSEAKSDRRLKPTTHFIDLVVPFRVLELLASEFILRLLF